MLRVQGVVACVGVVSELDWNAALLSRTVTVTGVVGGACFCFIFDRGPVVAVGVAVGVATTTGGSGAVVVLALPT